jgi:hypothetical protein
MPAGGVIVHLTAKCGGSVHDKGVIEITASSGYDQDRAPRNAADLGDMHSSDFSQNEPGAWIDWDFKALRIEPTHYTIRTIHDGPNNCHLKSWVVEG